MSTSRLQLFALVVAILLAATPLGCRWETDLPAEARAIAIDPSRELVISSDDVVSGPLAKNEGEGPFSFRHAVISHHLRDGALDRWLDGWSSRIASEPDGADRARTFEQEVTCRWLELRAANRCDDTCRTCAERELDLAVAPFRLLAIVNRTDLSVMPDRAADGGEARLVFALTDGPADDATSTTLPFSVIFEYAQDGSARSWAERWHALGATSDVDHPSRVADLTESFVAPGAIAQIRSADALTGAMLFHQFDMVGGELVGSNVRNTPDWGRVTASSIRAFAEAQSTALDDGTAVMPKAWWASSSSLTRETPSYLAEVPRHEAILQATCAGCHSQSATGFHVVPEESPSERLSRFLVDPSKPTDELRRRVEWMQLVLSR